MTQHQQPHLFSSQALLLLLRRRQDRVGGVIFFPQFLSHISLRQCINIVGAVINNYNFKAIFALHEISECSANLRHI
ncbi:hypothetical protein L3X38_035786 [Prunus dulcis]|uniref:Uncharacterized protein n=1 Tax=Prunus dulcis TaxID=3755 RepID=A0AAD4VM69_PRUDU|nr:hypothetical protein L3X38_035786 [Prunus dulcis]